MKKLIPAFLIGSMSWLIACGPSAEEIAKKEQARKDSIAEVERLKSEREAFVRDSIAQAEAAEQARQDSIRMAEEAAKNTGRGGNRPKSNKPAPAPAPTPSTPAQPSNPNQIDLNKPKGGSQQNIDLSKPKGEQQQQNQIDLNKKKGSN